MIVHIARTDYPKYGLITLSLGSFEYLYHIEYGFDLPLRFGFGQVFENVVQAVMHFQEHGFFHPVPFICTRQLR